LIFIDFLDAVIYNGNMKGKMEVESMSFRRGMGLKTKFSLWMGLSIIVIMGIVNLFFTLREKRILSEQIRLRGEAIARNVASNAEDPLGNKNDLLLSTFVHDAKRDNEGVLYCTIVDRDKKVWASTEAFKSDEIYTPPSNLEYLKNEEMLVQTFKDSKGREVYDVAIPIKIKDTTIGEVHLGISRQEIKRSIKETSKGMLIVTVVTASVGVIGILILVSFIIGSLGRITRDIESIGNGNLDRDIVIRRRDEIGRIAHSVKEMVAKLKNAREELVEKERMKKEMQIAREIQHTLLPQSIPEIPGFQIATYYESAKEVGGDYFDYIRIDKDHFGLVVADVSGKGVAGSLIMTMVRTVMRIHAARDLSPLRLVSIINFLLRNDIPESMFITLFYAVIDSSSGKISITCAGHNPAFYYSSSLDRVMSKKPKGPPLGIPLFDEKEFANRLEEERFDFAYGDVFFLYTDGITEAMNRNREQFGETQLRRLLSENRNKNADEIKKKILSSLEEFTEGTTQSDDITFVLLKRV
jgi:serine phosphatase RsbU (regulator of sigma subunit)